MGRKTANVVMSVGFGIPAFAVDTHVERICKHHDIVKKSATPLEVEKRVMDVLPPERWLPAHQAMIYFGRAICHPKILNVITIRNCITLKTVKKRRSNDFAFI